MSKVKRKADGATGQTTVKMSKGKRTADGATGSDQTASLKAYFVAEIRKMMEGFGDAHTPLLESAVLLENVVKEQMRSFVVRAAETSSMRGAKTIGHEDVLFLLRKNTVKLQRILKYVAVKDIQSNLSSTLTGASIGNTDAPPDAPSQMKRSHSCIEFLESIDQTGELTDTTIIPFDVIKHQRDLRAEKASRELDTEKYLEFSNVRRASFVSPRSASKFREWLKMKSDDDGEIPKILKPAYDLIGFVAYELVADLVDCAMLVRKEQARHNDQQFSRYMPGIGYSATDGVEKKQTEPASPLTPAEFHEAIRRMRNSPVGHANLFTRRHDRDTYAPLLGW